MPIGEKLLDEIPNGLRFVGGFPTKLLKNSRCACAIMNEAMFGI